MNLRPPGVGPGAPGFSERCAMFAAVRGVRRFPTCSISRAPGLSGSDLVPNWPATTHERRVSGVPCSDRVATIRDLSTRSDSASADDSLSRTWLETPRFHLAMEGGLLARVLVPSGLAHVLHALHRRADRRTRFNATARHRLGATPAF